MNRFGIPGTGVPLARLCRHGFWFFLWGWLTLSLSGEAGGDFPDTLRLRCPGSLAGQPAVQMELQRTAAQVTSTISTARAPIPADAPSPHVVLQVPAAFRPPVAVTQRVSGQIVQADGVPDPAFPEPYPFVLRLMPDGWMHWQAEPLALQRFLTYQVTLTWGTTPAANDQVVLEKLYHPWRLDYRPLEVATDATGRVATLSLHQRRMKAWPPALGQLTALRSLDLSNNQLTSLPPELGHLAQLHTLDLSNNQLTSLPPELGHLAHLQALDLSINQLTSLPPEFGHLAQLHTLDLGNNQLTSVPPELGHLAHLRTLGLGGNQLTSLLPELGHLAHLQALDLRSNQLTSLPPELEPFPALHTLDLMQNQFTNLTSSLLGPFPHLKELFLNSNPADRAPPG